MLSIKDYLGLKQIREYLDKKREEGIRENNGYSSQPVEEIGKMIKDLDRIILKLESED